MLEIIEYEFMRNAIFAGLLTSILCGILGALVVVNRIVFLAGGIAHAAYGGIGLSLFFKLPILPCTMGFSFLSSMLMASISLKQKHRADTIIGVIWAVGMAFGVILIDLTPGYNVDLMSYLFGSILSVSTTNLLYMSIMSIVVTALIIFFYNDILAMSYDEEFAKISGVPVNILYFSLICMLTITIIMVIQITGLILVIALLTIPPFIVEKYARSLAQMMIGSIILSALFTLTGLVCSYYFNLTSGASIIMVAGATFLITSIIQIIKK